MKKAIPVVVIAVIAVAVGAIYYFLIRPGAPCGDMFDQANAELVASSLTTAQIETGAEILERENALLCQEISGTGFPIDNETYLAMLFHEAKNAARDAQLSDWFERKSIEHFGKRPTGSQLPQAYENSFAPESG